MYPWPTLSAIRSGLGHTFLTLPSNSCSEMLFRYTSLREKQMDTIQTRALPHSDFTLRFLNNGVVHQHILIPRGVILWRPAALYERTGWLQLKGLCCHRGFLRWEGYLSREQLAVAASWLSMLTWWLSSSLVDQRTRRPSSLQPPAVFASQQSAEDRDGDIAFIVTVLKQRYTRCA